MFRAARALQWLGESYGREAIFEFEPVGTGRCKGAPNEEFLVAAGHQAAANESLFFVHTARHYLRWMCRRNGWTLLRKAVEPVQLDKM